MILFITAIFTFTWMTKIQCQGYDNTSLSVINHKQPWSALLENWVILQDERNNGRISRVMKLNEKPVTVTRIGSAVNKREVSETDLYLLSAIEKLLYRIDTLEKRLRRAEELLYFIISGNNSDKNPCPTDYMKIRNHCYLFSSRELDWKSSASHCRGLGGALIEFKSTEEKHEIEDYIQKDKGLRGKDFWTGGLNPGLLWIWASSAEQIYEDAVKTISGNGRCLKFQYKNEKKAYQYYGDDCSKKLKYICKLLDDESVNEIQKTSYAMFKTVKGE